jgi:hypothetical protein
MNCQRNELKCVLCVISKNGKCRRERDCRFINGTFHDSGIIFSQSFFMWLKVMTSLTLILVAISYLTDYGAIHLSYPTANVCYFFSSVGLLFLIYYYYKAFRKYN